MNPYVRWLIRFKSEAFVQMANNNDIDHLAFFYSVDRINAAYTKARFQLNATTKASSKSEIVCAFEDCCVTYIKFALTQSKLNSR